MSDYKNSDPFESYYVVKNINNHHSIWPDEKEIPIGWDVVRGPAGKEECLDWIEKIGLVHL